MTADIVVDPPEAVAESRARISTAREWLFVLGAVGLSLQTLSIWFSGLHPIFELANHFSAHAVWAGLVIVPGIIYFRRKLLAFCSSVAWGYLLLLVAPWSLYIAPTSLATAEQTSTSIKVLAWNVLVTNQSYAKIQAMVRERNPDVLVLIETPPGILEHLPEIVQNYPMSESYLHWGGGGICVFSRIAGTEFELKDFECPRQPAIVATIPSPTGTIVKLVGIHPLSPLPVARAYMRDKQLRAFAKWTLDKETPVCVCGDFNTTPWTASFQSLKASGLHDSREGVGNCPSWPRSLGPFGIPIDHVLTKGNCLVTNRQVLSNSPGSDHAPVAFTLKY